MHRFPYVEVEVSVRARESLPGIDVDRRHASLSYTPRHKLGVRGDLLRPGPRRLVDLARSGAAVNVRALALAEGGAPQRRELLQQGVFLQLIAEAPDTEELRVDPDGVADQAQLLRRDQSADLEVPAPHEERVQGGVPHALVQVRAVGEVVDDYQDLVQAAHFELLARLRDLALLVDDAPQGALVPVLEVDLLAGRVDAHRVFDVLLHWAPAVVDVDRGAKHHDALEAAAVLLQDHADQGDRLAALRGPDEDAGHGQSGHHRIGGLLHLVGRRGEDLDLAHLWVLQKNGQHSPLGGDPNWGRGG